MKDDECDPNTKKYKKCQERVLKEIEEKGLKDQNEFLVKNDFTKLRQNLKILLKVNGDCNKALELLKKKRLAKEEVNYIMGKLESEGLITTETVNRKTFDKCDKGEKGDRKEKKPRRERHKKDKDDKIDIEVIDRKDDRDMTYKTDIDTVNSKKVITILNDKLTNHWSPNFKSLYLDGNNMLFVDKGIRNLCLKGKQLLAHIILVKLSILFSINTELENLYIIFDSTDLYYSNFNDGTDIIMENMKDMEDGKYKLTEITNMDKADTNNTTNTSITNNRILEEFINNLNNQKLKIKVLSAWPKYNIADDFLVDLSLNEDNQSTLFVSSDKELQGRLFNNGIKYIMGSGGYFNILKKAFTEEKFEHLKLDFSYDK